MFLTVSDAAGKGCDELVLEMVARRAASGDAARAQVLEALKPLRKLTVAQERDGVDFKTAEGASAQLTVTMSVREALALVRATGPSVGALNGDGAAGRLLCSMGLAQRQLLHAGDELVGRRALLAALIVLKVAVNDCIAHVERNLAIGPKLLRRKAPLRRKTRL